jgi:Tol biopolymer transport system component
METQGKIGETPLESWKEIGAYLNRNEVTARRWEKDEGLPVHRQTHKRRSSVYAYPSELEAWRAARRIAEPPPPPLPIWRRLLTPSFVAMIAICVVTVGSFRPMEAGQGKPQERIQVCSGPDCNGRSVSPDGRSIMIALQSGGIGIRELSSGKVRTLVEPDAGTELVPRIFSPDGSRIVYERGKVLSDLQQTLAGIETMVMNTNGTASRMLCRGCGFALAWSPDGRRVLLAQFGDEASRAVRYAWVTVADGSIEKLPGDHVNLDSTLVSPDGRYIAFSASQGKDSATNLYVMASDGTGQVLVSPSVAEQNPVQWTSDGRLVFLQDGPSPSLWMVSMSNGKPQSAAVNLHADLPPNTDILGVDRSGALYYHVSSGGSQTSMEVARFDFAAGRVSSPPVSKGLAVQNPIPAQYDWSPDGKFLAYVTTDSVLGGRVPAIVVRSAENGVIRIIQSEGILLNAQPRWAPDSRTLLVPGLGGIHLIDTQTDKISTFKAGTALEKSVLSMPAWSPDQKKIYFAASPGADTVFFESDPDLKNLREVIRRPKMGGLNLTPDGRWIITPIVTTSETGALVAVPVAGGAPREFFSGPGKGNIFISPDGKYIALVNATPSTRALRSAWIVPTLGGEVREVFNVQAPMAVGMGTWAPDSKSIFLRTLGPDGQQADMWRVPVDGGKPVKIDTGLNLDQFTKYITASPAGNQIAYVRGAAPAPAKSEVWALKAFLPARATK